MGAKRTLRKLFLFLVFSLLFFLMLYNSGIASTGREDISKVAVAAGKEHSVVLRADGTVWAWGNNSFGQLGNGTIQNSAKPVRVRELDEVIAIAAGDYHTIALRFDGTVWAWGDNSYNQLGIKKDQDDVSTLTKCKPVQVKHLTKVISIAAGARHNLALRSDGTVRAWGDNSYGQLGDGTKESRESIRHVAYLGKTQAISAAGFSSAALLTDGTIRTWGANRHGHLGNGRRTGTQLLTARVEDLTTVTAVSMGTEHMVVLKEDGTVWAWGNNTSGQLGDGTRFNRLQPVKVRHVENALSIAAGEVHTLAVTSDGTVWAWGGNSYGQLGDGTTRDRPVPVNQKELQEIICIAAGDEHSLALDANGSIWAWGSNWSGYLGNDSTKSSNIPVKALLNLNDAT
ncbi:MAG: hypothetical protein GXZ07_07170 [Firmicutes bacterium]|nr:hypothetical protein [Bacillota bacterium]